MLIIGEKHNEVNVIHLILGEESDFQLNMSGHIVADITDNIDKTAEKNYILINRCDSEMSLQQQIKFFNEQFKEHLEKHVHKKDVNPPQTEEEPEEKKTNTRETNEDRGTFYRELRCSKCSSHGVWVKDGAITKCDVCEKIEQGLKNKDIPPPPSEEEKEEIIKELIKDPDYKNLYDSKDEIEEDGDEDI